VNPTAARRTCVHLRVCLALLPSGPDAVRRLKLHRVRAAVRLTHCKPAVYFAESPQANAAVNRSVQADYGRRQSFGSTDRIKNLGPSSGTSCRIAGSTFGSAGINVNPQTTVGFEARRASRS